MPWNNTLGANAFLGIAVVGPYTLTLLIRAAGINGHMDGQSQIVRHAATNYEFVLKLREDDVDTGQQKALKHVEAIRVLADTLDTPEGMYMGRVKVLNIIITPLMVVALRAYSFAALTSVLYVIGLDVPGNTIG